MLSAKASMLSAKRKQPYLRTTCIFLTSPAVGTAGGAGGAGAGAAARAGAGAGAGNDDALAEGSRGGRTSSGEGEKRQICLKIKRVKNTLRDIFLMA
jgi:hypothetical protein